VRCPGKNGSGRNKRYPGKRETAGRQRTNENAEEAESRGTYGYMRREPRGIRTKRHMLSRRRGDAQCNPCPALGGAARRAMPRYARSIQRKPRCGGRRLRCSKKAGGGRRCTARQEPQADPAGIGGGRQAAENQAGSSKGRQVNQNAAGGRTRRTSR